MNKHEDGFTLIELLMAMAIFSFMLVIVTAGYLQLMRTYESGLASRTTQQNARTVMDDLELKLRAAGGAWTNGGAGTALCFSTATDGVTEYAVFTNGAEHDMYRRTGLGGPAYATGNCPPIGGVAGWTKLNDTSVDVALFHVQTTNSLPGTNGTVVATLGLAARSFNTGLTIHNTGDPSQWSVSCQTGAGSQFCAATTLTTAAALRGN